MVRCVNRVQVLVWMGPERFLHSRGRLVQGWCEVAPAVILPDEQCWSHVDAKLAVVVMCAPTRRCQPSRGRLPQLEAGLVG